MTEVRKCQVLLISPLLPPGEYNIRQIIRGNLRVRAGGVREMTANKVTVIGALIITMVRRQKQGLLVSRQLYESCMYLCAHCSHDKFDHVLLVLAKENPVLACSQRSFDTSFDLGRRGFSNSLLSKLEMQQFLQVSRGMAPVPPPLLPP